MASGAFDAGAFDSGAFDTFNSSQSFVTTTYFFEVSGSLGFGTGGVQDRFPATGVTFPYAAVQLPTYAITITQIPNSSANLDFSQPTNSQYIPLLIP